MVTARARTELASTPAHRARAALTVFLEGLRGGAGLDTPPLAPGTGGPARAREFATGVGRRP
ncbi:hypothetical protein HUX53_26420 [Actinomadura sp. BRA 177]|nr:hypothetical protein [Actinomadura sp. BRA 177]